MAHACHYTYNTPIGKFTIESDGESVTRLVPGEVSLRGDFRPDAVTNLAANELQEYLAGQRRYFDVPVHLEGTRFQQDVWSEMLDIPYGQTRSYAQVARVVGRPNAYRAVGMAANRNPVPILVPWHRVVGSDGSLVGYAFGLKAKQYLLDLESEGAT